MRLSLETPALLFGAISLLLLAYTNRFLAIAALIRSLHDRYQGTHDGVVLAQIAQLRRRLRLIQSMQTFGATAFLLCLVTMGVVFAGWPGAGALFVASLALLMASLALSLMEIRLSVGALNLQLSDLEDPGAPARYPHVSPDAPRPLP